MASARSASFLQQPEIRLSFLLLLLFGVLTVTGLFEGLEVKTLDWRFRQRPAHAPDKRIVMLYITDECLAELGKWPWPRDLHARAIQALRKMGVATLIIDVLFQEPDDREPENDQKLIEAIRLLGRVVLPLHMMQVNMVNPETGVLSSSLEMVPPFPAMASTASTLGFINVEYRNLNPDGIVRRLPLFTRVGAGWFPSLALAAAQTASGKSLRLDEAGLFLGETLVPVHLFPSLEPYRWYWQLVFRPAFLVNYLGEADSGVFPMVFLSDLLRGDVDPAFLKDKIVLMGPSAVGMADIKLTPYGEMPGVMIHANVLQNLINNNFLVQTGPWGQCVILAALAGLMLLTLRYLRTLGAGLAVIALILGFVWLARVLFLQYGLVVDLILPVLMLISQFTLVRFLQMYCSLQEAYGSLQDRSQDLERSNRSLDQQVRDLSQLNVAGNRFSTTLEIDALCHEVMATFGPLWESTIQVISVWDQETEQMQLLGQQGGTSDEDVRLTLFDPVVVRHLQRMMETRRVVVDPGPVRWYNCFVPLPLGARIWGAILLNSPKPNEVLQGREDFWATISGLAATALENSRLYNLATVDTLTRMYVRRYLQVTIDQEFKRARRFKHAISVLMTDIDHFKSFNDTFGHQQGDMVLREVSSVVRRSLRDIDIPARYGGEEFCVVLPETNSDGAYIVAERIRRNVEQLCIPRLNSPGEPLRVTISLGVATFPEMDAESSEDMIKMADVALYQAKQAGRNRTVMGRTGHVLSGSGDLLTDSPVSPEDSGKPSLPIE